MMTYAQEAASSAVTAEEYTQQSPSGDTTRLWRMLMLVNGFRLVIALLFSTLGWWGETALLGQDSPHLFRHTTLIYLLSSVLAIALALWRRPALIPQVSLYIFFDVICITLLMHASGGIASGLGMLLLVYIAGGGMVLGGYSAAAFAALGSAAMLIEHIYSSVQGTVPTSYTLTGLLAASFLATALITQGAARRARESEVLAAQRGVDLANMQQLTDYVIQRMQTGVVVIDSHGQVRLMNDSARHLIGTSLPPQRHVAAYSGALEERWQQWCEGRDDLEPFHAAPGAMEVTARFARLGAPDEQFEKNVATLLFLEDNAAMAQQAQQLKLASLGRLTASIAHEIRNPLGAITHAAQLLDESPHLDAGELRMTQIIRDQAARVNTIIESILQLSRRERAKPLEFPLAPWLVEFAAEFRRQYGQADAESLLVEGIETTLIVRFDPAQLHQVLWNLCTNGWRYGSTGGQHPRLVLRMGEAPPSDIPYLDIIDNGPGVSPEALAHLFEPFFTTNAKGTGLGLFICRELCQANKARLNYLPHETRGCCFRITFSDPRRR